jgi:hypothetical protein
MIGTAVSFVVLEQMPIDFNYAVFAVLLFVMGLTMASFGSPNRAAVMNSLPPRHRGSGSGMNSTFQNSAQVLSIGLFFTLIIVGFSHGLPESLNRGLIENGVPASTAHQVSSLPPVATLFAAFLGYNPIQHLIGPHVLATLTPAQQHTLTSRTFFPGLISGPFHNGIRAALDFAIGMSILAAACSWIRGGRYEYVEAEPIAANPESVMAG